MIESLGGLGNNLDNGDVYMPRNVRHEAQRLLFASIGETVPNPRPVIG